MIIKIKKQLRTKTHNYSNKSKRVFNGGNLYFSLNCRTQKKQILSNQLRSKFVQLFISIPLYFWFSLGTTQTRWTYLIFQLDFQS